MKRATLVLVKLVIVSGYFNPLHSGHLDMMEKAAELGDRLLVVVNNDKQQMLKKGKIILPQENRYRLVNALRVVDEVLLSVDQDPTVIETLRIIAKTHPYDELIFANGGDRDSDKVIPETDVCNEYSIKLVFGLGDKVDSSTRINQATGHETA